MVDRCWAGRLLGGYTSFNLVIEILMVDRIRHSRERMDEMIAFQSRNRDSYG